jgi:putative NADH-flavin reductase
MAQTKSKILFIGGTGYIGKFIVEASAKAGHPTFALVREPTLSDPAKSKIIESFKASGVNFVVVRTIPISSLSHSFLWNFGYLGLVFVWILFLQGDLYNHESLVKAIKQVDVVISTVGHGQLADQGKIIAAIKEAGNVKVAN